MLRSIGVLACLAAIPTVLPAAPLGAETPVEPVLAAMHAELSRSFEVLKEQPVPPYFLCYEMTEVRSVRASSSFGALVSSFDSRRRRLDIDLRVGDYTLDNTRQLRGQSRRSRPRRQSISMPVDDDADSIAATLWYHTDKAYKNAVEDLTKVRTNVRVKVEQEDQSHDFSREEPSRFVGDVVDVDADLEDWEARVRRYTAPFAQHGEIYRATADLTATATTRWLLNSEGTALRTSDLLYRLSISAMTKADDGMELPRYESFTAFTPDGLPGDAEVLARVRGMIEDLEALRKAPIVDPYTGPAILSGRASGVFFHEVFGHRIEGHRQKRESEGQTFKNKVGESILPEQFTIHFDPSIRRAAGVDLAGHYLYDNEGVKARRVPVVEHGVFRNFLMSRTPIDDFPASNGHGRRQPGYAAVARQSNLIVDVSDPLPHSKLQDRLLGLIREENKPFGLIFEDIQGGFTITGRTIPNSFNVLPILVYRIFPDGRRELVRGVDFIGTPLTAFSSLVGGDDRFGVFNGTCGAESGGVPVSAVSPGILLRQIEVQKKEKSQERPPLLPAPAPAVQQSDR